MKYFLRIHTFLFYLLILLLPTQLGIHFWPSWAMVLGRRIDYLSPTLYITDVLIISLLFFWFVEKVYEKRKKPVFTRILNVKTVLLSIFVIVNIFVAVSRPVAVYTWIKCFEFILLGVYIVKTKPKIARIVFFLSVSVLYSSLIAIAQFLLQHSIGGVFWFLGERTFNSFTPGIAQIPLCLPWASGCPLLLRSYATFSHPNMLGGYLATLLPLIIYQSTNLKIYKLTKQQFLKWFYGATITLAVLTLILTFSRSAWAAGIVGIGAWYLVFRKKKKIVLPYLTIVVLFFVCFMISIIAPQFLGDSESVVVRAQLNKSAISLITHSPFFGVGLGNFLVKLPEALPSRMIYFLQPVHNIYLLLVSEVGLVGSIIIGWLLLKTIRNYREKMSSPLIIYCLLLMMLLGFVDHYPLTLQQGQLLFTLFIALVLQ